MKKFGYFLFEIKCFFILDNVEIYIRGAEHPDHVYAYFKPSFKGKLKIPYCSINRL